jgi:hypothetical protein
LFPRYTVELAVVENEMSSPERQEVSIPFFKKKVPVVVDLDRHPALDMIAKWGTDLKGKIEDACFANYQEKVASIGLGPSMPRIKKPTDVWKHLEIRHVRIDAGVKDTVVLYVVPAWDIEEQMEWCIKGHDQLVYVGQFLQYPVDGYGKCPPSINSASKKRSSQGGR